MTEVEVFGLLHLQEKENSAVNLRIQNFEEQIQIYLGNASLLSKSFDSQGIQFTLLTNDAERIELLQKNDSYKLKIRQIEFPTSVPSGISFYSAHFKVDVFRYISTLNAKYVLFCDLDMVCLKPLPSVFKTLISENIPLVYEVTNQIIPANGHEAMINELQTINLIPSEGRWIGGEFFAGSPQFFKQLVSGIDEVLPSYFKHMQMRSISSLGNDEVYSTAAIEKLRRNNVYVGEAGLMNIVGRYWSSGTGYIQKPFKHFENVFLLHLPADKKILNKFNLLYKKFDPNIFLKYYKNVLKIQNLRRTPRKIFYFIYALKTKTPFLKQIVFDKNIKKFRA